MLSIILTGIVLTLCLGCFSLKNKDFIGSAVIETPTYQVTTTEQGILLDVMKDEGMAVQPGELIAVVDTIPLLLQQNEILATMAQLDQTIASKKADYRLRKSISRALTVNIAA